MTKSIILTHTLINSTNLIYSCVRSAHLNGSWMEPKIVGDHLHTQLTWTAIRHAAVQERPSGGSKTTAEGRWSTLALRVSVSILRERGSNEGWHNIQAGGHACSIRDLLFVEEINLLPRCTCQRIDVVASKSADRHKMPPLLASWHSARQPILIRELTWGNFFFMFESLLIYIWYSLHTTDIVSVCWQLMHELLINTLALSENNGELK